MNAFNLQTQQSTLSPGQPWDSGTSSGNNIQAMAWDAQAHQLAVLRDSLLGLSAGYLDPVTANFTAVWGFEDFVGFEPPADCRDCHLFDTATRVFYFYIVQSSDGAANDDTPVYLGLNMATGKQASLAPLDASTKLRAAALVL